MAETRTVAGVGLAVVALALAIATCVDYRGSTYSLALDGDSGQLEGLYFQATLRQQFDVVFVRPR